MRTKGESALNHMLRTNLLPSSADATSTRSTPPSSDARIVAEPLLERFEAVLGPLDSAEIPQAVREQARALQPTFLSEEWLYKKSRKRPGRAVKIATGVKVVDRLHKAPGGLIRATLELRDNRLVDIALSGDFFCYPQDAVERLEAALEGTALAEAERTLAAFYSQHEVETPGVTIADWIKVLSARVKETLSMPASRRGGQKSTSASACFKWTAVTMTPVQPPARSS